MNTAAGTPRLVTDEGDVAAGELPRLLPGRCRDGPGPATLASHLARHGRLPAIGNDAEHRRQLVAEVHRAGLTGRGGAAFRTARKLAAVTAARQIPVVIANGTEGEPASAKDKVLLAQAPHLVLDGAVLASGLTGARQAIVVVHGAVREIVDDAVAERRRTRYDPVPITVLTGADWFVGGEASALVNWVSHGIPAPTAVPPRVSERGLGGRPTLVQNVETLAHLALIVRHGPAWFRSLGTPAEPGSMLVTVIGAVGKPGAHEIGIGTPIGDVLTLAGGPAAPLSALLIGGYFGTWVNHAAAAARPFSVAGLRPAGASPGAGLIAALPVDACGLAETARIARYLAAESAGQCGPCVFGLDSIATELEALAAGRPVNLGRLGRWLGQVAGRGACHHPDGAGRMIRSALGAFDAEIAEHARGWCCGTRPAGVLPVPFRVIP
jgi:NADH:ubiquinone oxidoreductase subunit F (NADH-binding)